jgi:predicted metal-dependent hydrolase
MRNGLHTVRYGETTIEYQLSFAERKTLAISVHPDLQVTVIAPDDTDLETIQSKVKKRAGWILKQQRELELYLPPTLPRQYVSGETHRYLGRQYRLKIVQNDSEQVRLIGGRLIVTTRGAAEPGLVKTLLDAWYLEQAWRIFPERLDALLPHFRYIDMPEPQLAIKALTARWGSCSQSGVITLNLKLIQVPKPYIDYVIVHELCHLIEHNHSKRFYMLLDRMMPDWRQRRQKLNALEFA